ncbi:MAG: hypothetical protein KC583_10690, partial [Myxococcales bacterium]|nr:hypothetical protein [Myxococcales bacterium]
PADLEPVTLPDDGACDVRRTARLETEGVRPEAPACRVTEHLDAQGCVAVRVRTTVEGLVTRTMTEVPGEGFWVPQPPSFVDTTPHPGVELRRVDAEGREVEWRQDFEAPARSDNRRVQTWSAAGELTRREMWWGDAHSLERWVFDDEGREVRMEHSSDGTLHVVETAYDGEGQMVLRRALRDGVEVGTTSWTYDHAGRVVSQVEESDGRVERVNHVYDLEGRELERWWRRDEIGGASIVEHHTFEHRADGSHVEVVEQDRGDDGVIELRVRVIRDAEGREPLFERDDDADGQVDTRRVQQWDEAGRMVLWENTRDGVVTLRRTWTFDGDEQIEQTSFPAPAQDDRRTWRETRAVDGDTETLRTFIDDAPETVTVRRLNVEGEVVDETVDTDADGVVDQRTTQRFDSEGRLVERAVDGDGDGAVDARLQQVVDASGELAYSASDDDGDGTPERWTRTVRDASGRVVFEASFPAFEGAAFRAVTDYACD